jgi:peroxiredoxin
LGTDLSLSPHAEWVIRRIKMTGVVSMREVPDLKPKGYVPDLSLPSTDMTEWNIRSGLRKRNLVIYLAHGPSCDHCRARLRALGADFDRWRGIRAEIVPILPRPLEELQFFARELELPFPILSDGAGQTQRAFGFQQLGTVEPPMAFVIDRFATLYYHRFDDGADTRREANDLFDEVEFLESQCPECGVYG